MRANTFKINEGNLSEAELKSLAEARERILELLKKPHMSRDALRERARLAAEWEEANPEISVPLCGRLEKPVSS